MSPIHRFCDPPKGVPQNAVPRNNISWVVKACSGEGSTATLRYLWIACLAVTENTGVPSLQKEYKLASASGRRVTHQITGSGPLSRGTVIGIVELAVRQAEAAHRNLISHAFESQHAIFLDCDMASIFCPFNSILGAFKFMVADAKTDCMLRERC